jgi:hypothetical protein
MTHAEASKLIARQLGPRGPRERWIIKTRFRPDTFRYDGDAYWGARRDGTSGLTPYRSNASEYESENAALAEGYELKEARLINDFTVEQLPPKPERRSYGYGTGGRA